MHCVCVCTRTLEVYGVCVCVTPQSARISDVAAGKHADTVYIDDVHCMRVSVCVCVRVRAIAKE